MPLCASPPLLPVREARTIVCGSRGIAALRHLPRFLGAERVVDLARAPRTPTDVDAVVVWGLKDTGRQAFRYAERHGLPVWRLEDGWIRSASKGAHGRTSYSLSIDPLGVYYDARSPSTLERLLQLDHDTLVALHSPDALVLAHRLRRRLVGALVTKYNFCRRVDRIALEGDGRPLVLVIDQTRDDASVRFGGMDESRFEAMLAAAVAENPDARVVVRTHPDVAAGRRRGYLTHAATRLGVELRGAPDNPLPWLKRAARVYVGTSQLGYEALLAERPVTVFGQPFYAGWGLTDDRQPIPRRTATRSIDEMFLATHLLFTRYRHPLTGDAWGLEDCIEHVATQRRWHRRNAATHVCVGITPWKRGFLKQYLASPDGEVRFVSASEARTTQSPARVVCWSYRDDRFDGSDAGEDALDKRAVVRVEDGFLRSRGLGSDYVMPTSLAFDRRGLYFDARAPSDLEYMLRHHECTDAERKRGAELRDTIRRTRVSKYNVHDDRQVDDPSAATRSVLVVGQVEGDQSLRRGSPMLQRNRDLLLAVRDARPDSFIVFKPHPDVTSGNRAGSVPDAIVAGLADAVDTESSLVDCLERCDELHTMTSQAGFEALMHGCKVVTWGAPFYAGWGLTEDRIALPRRGRRRTLDELVYLALVRYPRYLDTASGDFIEPEDVLAHWSQAVSAPLRRPGHPLQKLANLVRALRHAA